jgi:hypothetical protein
VRLGVAFWLHPNAASYGRMTRSYADADRLELERFSVQEIRAAFLVSSIFLHTAGASSLFK